MRCCDAGVLCGIFCVSLHFLNDSFPDAFFRRDGSLQGPFSLSATRSGTKFVRCTY